MEEKVLKKKIISILLVCCLGFSVTACTSKSAEKGSEKDISVKNEEMQNSDGTEAPDVKADETENAEKDAKADAGNESDETSPDFELQIQEEDNDSSRKNKGSSEEKGSAKLKGAQISTENALALIEEKYGKNGSKDKETGNERSYVYEDIQEVDGETYFNYRYSWIVFNEENADHISKIGNIFVSTDGSKVMYAEKTEDGWKLYNPKNKAACIFLMENDGGKESAATLILNDDYTFSFSYNPLSSYLPYGRYKIADKKITCSTMDGKYTYIFDVVDDYTVTFNEGESSELEMADSVYAKPKHGSIFKSQK